MKLDDFNSHVGSYLDGRKMQWNVVRETLMILVLALQLDDSVNDSKGIKP